MTARLPAAAPVGLLLAGAVAGCTPELPAPVVNGVHPGWGFNGEDTTVEIQGQAFYPRVQVSGRERVEQDHDFVIVLETEPETTLSEVVLVDYRHLQAVVPAGLPTGTYGVRVETPSGAAGSLADAFEVRDTRADQLRVTPADGQLSWRVLEYASLSIELVDPDGQRVAEDLEIQVSAEGLATDTLQFQPDTLQDQQPLADGTGISGRLGPDGSGTVALTSTEVAEAVLLRIDAADAESGISGALQILSFTPGDVAGVRIELPSPVFDTTAGSRFEVDLSVVDVSGNVVEGADTLLVLYELCSGGSLLESHSFVGQATGVELAVTRATVDGCDANAIVAAGLSAGAVVSGQSNLFGVAPGEAVGLALDVWPDEVVAGEDEVLAQITAIDGYDNRALDSEGPVDLEASADGGPFEAPLEVRCYDLVEGESYCLALLATAGQDVVLLASTSGPEGLTGVSAPFTVLPGEASELLVEVTEDPVVAGEATEVRLQARDGYGNGVLLDPLGADQVTLSTGSGDVDCDWDRTDDDGTTELYACTFTVALADQVLEAELPSRGLAAVSGPFEVINGPLDEVGFTLGAGSVVAGQELAVRVVGADAFGNAYVEQDDPVVALADSTGSVAPDEVVLGADGAADLSVVITVARDEVRLSASQGGALLGTSGPFDVIAGEVAGLELLLPATFAWLDEGSEVTVQAVDAYGNVAPTHGGAVVLSSSSGWGADLTIAGLDDGQATVTYTWDQAGLEDLLRAEDGTYSASAAVDVLDGDCAAPPGAALTVGGDAPAVLCRLTTTGSTRLVTVSAAGSTPGDAALARYHLLDEAGEWTASDTGSWSMAWDSVGGRTLAVVVADEEACGASTEVQVYVGNPDGSPAGPVELELDSDTLSAGDSTGDGVATVDVAATDCAGDPAAGEILLVRADLGAVDTSSGVVAASGKGLELTLDSAGLASFEWTMAEEVYGGTATLRVGLAEAVAYGEAQVAVTNDAVRPAVQAVAPAGTTSATYDTVEIQLTEPLFADTVTTSTVSLLDPDGLAVDLADEDLSLDDRLLRISLAEPLDAALGTWTLVLGSSLRDLDGNRLDGTWTGSRSDFELDFGAVADEAPDLTSCRSDTATLRPDGDDGSGDEADVVSLRVTAGAVPAWWRMVVSDADGQAVRTRWVPEGSASSADLDWDGRDDDGLVAGNGSYRVVISPADVRWNLGASCTIDIRLDNRLVAP